MTVASTSLPTTINGTSVPFVSTEAVTSIMVTLPGTTNFDTVSLLGAGKTTPTTVKNVSITGPPGRPRPQPPERSPPMGSTTTARSRSIPFCAVNAALTAHVDNSSFQTVAIYQAGGSKAVVELGNNTIPGPAAVHEGYGNKDSITVDNGNVSGPTELYQGRAAPTPALGTADSVTVTNATTRNLDIQQLIDGTANTINVNTVSVASVSYGVNDLAGQRRWRHDHDQPGHNPHSAQSHCTWRWPAQHRRRSGRRDRGVVLDGTCTGNDSASVTNSTLPGSISITQADVAGNARAIRPRSPATRSGSR